MPQSQQLVRITTPDKTSTPLSKAQKEFNRLTKRIGELEIEIKSFRETVETIQQRINVEYRPLLTDYNRHRADLVRVFDHAYDRPEATKTEKKKLAHLITDLAYELIDMHGMDEMKPIFDKYDEDGFDETTAETDGLVSEVMKDMVSSMYGITFDPDVDVSTQEKFEAYVQEQLQSRQAEHQQQRQQTEEKKVKKPKTAKQQEREAKKQLEERNITKAVRTLYMDLVKAFHPDREPDEAEKKRKTAVMQRITEAYEKSDLLALFRLQLEFNRIDQQHLETLADDQLKYYNKILKQQAVELGDELHEMRHHLSAMLGKPLMFTTTFGLEYSFNNDLRELKSGIKAVKREVKDLRDPAMLKAWLKAYKIPKANDYDDLGTYFG